MGSKWTAVTVSESSSLRNERSVARGASPSLLIPSPYVISMTSSLLTHGYSASPEVLPILSFHDSVSAPIRCSSSSQQSGYKFCKCSFMLSIFYLHAMYSVIILFPGTVQVTVSAVCITSPSSSSKRLHARHSPISRPVRITSSSSWLLLL